MASSTINSAFYRSNTPQSLVAIPVADLLSIYNLTNTANHNYYYLYRPSTAPTSAYLPNAGWSRRRAFYMTCPAVAVAVDLTGRVDAVADQVAEVPFSITTHVSNLGTLATPQPVGVTLQFDYNTNGYTPGQHNDFAVRATTTTSLALGASVVQTFPNITNAVGYWRVRMIVDQDQTNEPDITTRANNITAWETYYVNPAPGTPQILLVSDHRTVEVGSSHTLLWTTRNIISGTCSGSGAWTGGKPDTGHEVQTPTVPGNLTYKLTCTGIDNRPLSAEVMVQVTGDPIPPDLTIQVRNVTTCTPSEIDDNGVCAATIVKTRIRNSSSGATPTGKTIPYKLELSADNGQTWTPLLNSTVASLSGNTLSPLLTYTIVDKPIGDYKVRAQVNQPNTNTALGETNFTNNISNEVSFSITPGAPVITLTADKPIARKGGTTTINWTITAPYNPTCHITGAGMPNGAIEKTGHARSTALLNSQTFTVTCDAGLGYNATTKSITVPVIPSIYEI